MFNVLYFNHNIQFFDFFNQNFKKQMKNFFLLKKQEVSQNKQLNLLETIKLQLIKVNISNDKSEKNLSILKILNIKFNFSV